MTKTHDIKQSEKNSEASLRAQILDLQARLSVLERDNVTLSRDNKTLAQTNAELTQNNVALSSEVSSLTKKYTTTITNLECQLKEQQTHIERLYEQIRLANCRFFGSKSEKVVPEQLSLFNDVEFSADKSAKEPELVDGEDDKDKSKKPRRGGKRKIDLSRFETVVIEHKLDDSERTCHQCEGELEEMGYEVTKKLRLVPAHFVVEEHRVYKYRCHTCCDANAKGEEVASVIKRAHTPQVCLPGSIATASLLSYIINAKYVNFMPLYRLENDFASLGAPISRQNMANWVIAAYEKWLIKIHERIRAELLSHTRIHIDETETLVLKEPNREPKAKSRCWVFCSAESDVPAYVYEYHPTRSKRVAEEFLRGWSGTITTDGYSPYFSLNTGSTITNVACLAHARRKFAEIVKAAGGDKKASGADSIALEGRHKIDAIFSADKKFNALSADERKQKREEVLRPLMEEFDMWLDEQIPKASPMLALHEALKYAKKLWPYVMNVLKDGNLVLTNNVAERAIKPYVIARKNFLFSDTPRGANASCAMFSIVTTARENGITPRPYLEWLLTELPKEEELTDEVLDSYLPWSDKVPEKFRLTPKQAQKLEEIAQEPIIDIDPKVLSEH